MSTTSTLPVLASANTVRPGSMLRSVGDANSSRALDGENSGEDAFRRGTSADRRNAQASHIGTRPGAPLWNGGPRLRPAFVAQVLGQVMMDAQTRALSLAPAAYRERIAQVASSAFDDAI
jgi:hypothetical protein